MLFEIYIFCIKDRWFRTLKNISLKNLDEEIARDFRIDWTPYVGVLPKWSQ